MKTISFVFFLAIGTSICSAQTFDADGTLEKLHADRVAIKRDFAEANTLIDVVKGDKKKLADATYLMDTVDNLLERTGTEGWLLEMYNHVTNASAQVDAEQLMRKHYSDMAALTAVDLEAATLISKKCGWDGLCKLANRFKEDAQSIDQRYESLSKPQ